MESTYPITDPGNPVAFGSTDARAIFISRTYAHLMGAILAFTLLGGLNIVFSIISGMKANQGEDYRYPFALRIITEAHFAKFVGTGTGP
ncbi:MAG: DUF4870 domain-containing protein [Myxococcales bacterium]|nr:DUF4870 domain-containing protein [Myxococcales bacterium]